MNALFIGLLSMVLTGATIAHGSSASPLVQGTANAPAPTAAEFLARWKDERNHKLVRGALWTASHSDSADLPADTAQGELLERLHEYYKAISTGDPSALEPGAMRAFKERLSALLQDEHQGIRALAAIFLGVCGDRSYASHIAVLLEPQGVIGDLPRFDRGRAAIALGLLGAKEYTLDLVTLLKSANGFDRSGAAFGVGALRATDHEEAIRRLLNDEEEHVRDAAKEALTMMREKPR